MLEKFAKFFASKNAENFGFYLNRDLEDCGKDIMAVFDISDFDRDYEDTWEWVEGKGQNGLHVNISRPHNWKNGEYTLPVVVRVSGPLSKLTDEFLSRSAQALADRLRTKVWIGNVVRKSRNDSHYDFEIEKEFTPNG
jgi:hypothetical protein